MLLIPYLETSLLDLSAISTVSLSTERSILLGKFMGILQKKPGTEVQQRV